MTHLRYLYTLIFTACILGATTSALAASISFDASDSGAFNYYYECYLGPCSKAWWHEEPLTEVTTRNLIDDGFLEYGYAIYDLSGLNGTVQSASLALNVSDANMFYSGAPDNLYAYAIGTSIADLLSAPTGTLSEQTFNDLNPFSGASVGSVAIAPDSAGNYLISLSQLGLDRINDGGLIAFGLRWCGFNCNGLPGEYTAYFNAAPKLIVNGSDLVDISEPSILALFCLTLLPLYLLANRRLAV